MKTSLLIKHLLGTLLFFALIFLAAGRPDYWQGWVYVGIGLVMFVLNHTALRVDADLSRERSNPGAGAKNWDKLLLGLLFLLMLGMYVVAGLDSGRYRWSPGFPLWVYLAGALLTAAGQLLFLVAQKQNKFFSSTVRIQTDRAHAVCDTGLYRFVRHPAYLGSVVQLIGFPLLFGSRWSIPPIAASIVVVVVRTALEDRLLKNELTGYREYAQKTRFRLVPYLW